MAVSINWRFLFVGVLMIRAILFGVDMRPPDCWKLAQHQVFRSSKTSNLRPHFELRKLHLEFCLASCYRSS